MATEIATQEALNTLFNPRGVAVIDASDDIAKLIAGPGVIFAEALHAAAAALSDRLQAIDAIPVILGPAGAIAVDAPVVPRA
jgi:hypothetical protein